MANRNGPNSAKNISQVTNWMKYGDIQKNKKLGFSRTQVSKMLRLDKKTVAKYWDMNLEEYSKILDDSQERNKRAMKYKNEILDWLQRYPDMISVIDYCEVSCGEVSNSNE